MSTLLPETEIARLHGRLAPLREGLRSRILGQDSLIDLVLTGLLARGHVLLEGLPGLGKTELVKTLAALTGLDFRRIQFTPDLLPGDITGTQMLLEHPERGRELVFRPGPVFAQIVLADEINRASPKTQSALLEAMQEQAVTVLDGTRRLPDPFFVLATQNPVEMDGTYPLPEAQLDRFALKAQVLGVDEATLLRIVADRPSGRLPPPAPVLDAAGVLEILAAVERVVVPEAVARYIARLVHATRPDRPEADAEARAHLRWGASPRAAIALAATARARALLEGRPAVGFGDVKALAGPVVAHRLIPRYEATLSGVTPLGLVAGLVERVPELAA